MTKTISVRKDEYRNKTHRIAASVFNAVGASTVSLSNPKPRICSGFSISGWSFRENGAHLIGNSEYERAFLSALIDVEKR